MSVPVPSLSGITKKIKERKNKKMGNERITAAQIQKNLYFSMYYFNKKKLCVCVCVLERTNPYLIKNTETKKPYCV